MVLSVAVLASLLAVVGDSPKQADSAPRRSVSADVAPLYFAAWLGFHQDGYSDRFNLQPEGSLASIGLKVEYGHRFTRRFELAGGVEYLRTPPFARSHAQHLRATTTPSVVFGNGRRYDFSIGGRFGISGIHIAQDWAPQLTTLAVLRNRIWVHEKVGLMLSASSGVHWGVADGTGGLQRVTTFELVALRLGVATRF